MAPSKTASKMASKKKTDSKQTVKKGVSAPAKGKESKDAKSGAFGSLKKMLGLPAAQKGKAAASKKEAPKEMQKKAAPTTASASAKTQKPAAPTAPAKSAKGAKTPPAAAAPQKPAKPAGGKEKTGKRGQSQSGVNASLTTLSRQAGGRTSAQELSHGAPVCREVACELMATTGGYCRMHYIKNWKRIKRKEIILKEKKLNSYIEELVSKYPDKYIEAIRQDLASEKDFAKVIADLEIDESMDDFESIETESAEGIIDNLKRDFDDEGDVF